MAAHTTAPVFVVGASRSGTTLMSRVVARSDDIRAFAEVHFFERLYRPGESPTVLDKDAATTLAARLEHTQHRGLFYKQGSTAEYTATGEEIVGVLTPPYTPMDVYAAFLDHEARRRGGTRACDQTPRNVFYIRDILEAFPDARVINMVRDPRAVMLSQKNKWRRRSLGESALPRSEVLRSWSNYSPLVTARLWAGAVDAADRFAGDDRVLTVRFEDLLGDGEGSVRKVAQHVGVEFSPTMLDVPMESSSLAADTSDARGLRTEQAEAWRAHGGLSSAEIHLCQRIAGEQMRRHEYTADSGRPSPVGVAGWYAVAPVKLGVAAVMNFRQIGNPITAARRRFGH